MREFVLPEHVLNEMYVSCALHHGTSNVAIDGVKGVILGVASAPVMKRPSDWDRQFTCKRVKELHCLQRKVRWHCNHNALASPVVFNKGKTHWVHNIRSVTMAGK